MKTLVLGDIHGRTIWKTHIDKVQPDKVIFVGDYFDSFDISTAEQIHNFKDIISLKEDQLDDVILLIGNHDAHYMGINETYSGYQGFAGYGIIDMLREHRNRLQFAHSFGPYLFTHAGVTKDWCELIGIDQKDIVNQINQSDIKDFRFQGHDPYGDSTKSSPIWVRPRSLMLNKIHGWHQIVGHTTQQSINLEADTYGFTFIDTLGTSTEALIISEGSDGYDLSVSKL